jgi:hypothetical protein
VARDESTALMRTAATALLGSLNDEQRAKASLAFTDEPARQHLEYRPRPRPGVALADLGIPAHKAAHRLLATALSTHAYAQAVTIIGLEEVLDRAEGYRRGRHSEDYWVTVFGDPARDDAWGWRFEGHHLSVSMTVLGDQVVPTPIFLGANPARTDYRGRPVVRPLAPEEDLARALLAELTPAARIEAVVATSAPADIRTSVSPRVDGVVTPLGVGSGALGPSAREFLHELVGAYLDRLPPRLATIERARITGAELFFAWEGSERVGEGHYYRVQGPDLLIEYDNTANDANHAHTVLRRPLSDFGGDVLAAHRANVLHPE